MGKKLSEITTKQVIIMVLTLILVMPLFATDYWNGNPPAVSFAVESLNQVIDDPNLESKDMTNLITEIKSYFDDRYQPLIRMTVPAFKISGTKSFPGYDETYIDDFGKYRTSEYTTLVADDNSKSIDVTLVTSQREDEKLEALLNIFRTIFVCFVLACGSLMISKDVNEIALQPLEEMIEKVNLIA